MTTAEAGRQVAENLTAEVTRIMPEAIFRWDPVWEMVGDSDAAFLVVLFAWEAHPTDEGEARVRAAYHAVLQAWRLAVAEWRGSRGRRRGFGWREPADSERRS